MAGREATWEATRPMVLPAGESQKLRGFIDYRRHAISLPPLQQMDGVHVWASLIRVPCSTQAVWLEGGTARYSSNIALPSWKSDVILSIRWSGACCAGRRT